MRTRHTSSQPRTAQRAFSLIEIMVAVTLLVVITVGLLSMFYHTQRAFRLGAGQVDTLEAGRSTVQMMSREMQEMFPSHIPLVINLEALPIGNARLDMDLPGGFYRTNLLQDISFLSKRGDEWIGITYRVDHADRGAGTLYRSMISTNPAIQNGPMRVPEWQVISNLFLAITAPAVLSPDPAIRDTNFHRVADGVVHLRVRGAYNDRGQIYPEATPGYYGFTNEVPAYIELEVGILDPKAVTQLDARSTVPSARTYVQGQAHRLHLFTQRIPVRAHHAQFDLFTFSPSF